MGGDGRKQGGRRRFSLCRGAERLAFVDAFRPGWRPTGKPFMAAAVLFEDEPIARRASVPIRKFLSSLSVDVEGAAAEALDGRQDIVG